MRLRGQFFTPATVQFPLPPYYSAPNALVGQVLGLRVTAHVVEMLHRDQRVASHMRCAHKGGFTTTPKHLPERHQAHAQWTPERLVSWGARIGLACAQTVQLMLARPRQPEHACLACLGLLSLSKRYGDQRLEVAYAIARQLGTAKYTHIQDILINRRDFVQPCARPCARCRVLLVKGPIMMINTTLDQLRQLKLVSKVPIALKLRWCRHEIVA